ncbi:phosphatidylinositol 4-kinase beta 1-like [Pyrus ussuriensis x Pyrus communis]|uniref:Phosphatidylinositol 4-kinase beta 1-like n=1 Tax=Pyrus ussuriensis x Pyrus communis TaxID=2448454 RepID=A0A5N5GFY3_9ROSA|nr:phosphatidylinositol 4-kinase beta 1-like [Pyrus ussuriensis x Pyrus communis]
MSVHKPSPSLDKFVIDMCSKSLKIALKVHWFLLAELEDSDDNEGINRIQEKCQIAATLMGPKVRDALLFRKSVENDDDDSEKDGFFKRLLRDSRGDDETGSKLRDSLLFRKSSEKDDDAGKDGFFKRLLRDSKGDDEELTSSSEGFFKRLFRDSKSDNDNKSISKSVEDEEKEGFFRKIFKDKSEDKKDRIDRNEDEDAPYSEEKGSKSAEDDEKEGFFRKFFRDKFDDKKDGNDKTEEGSANGDEEELSDFSLFRRLLRVHPEDAKSIAANENSSTGGLPESSPGTENFFRKLFRDRDRSVEDSELFGSRKHKEKRPGSPKQQNEKSSVKPPLPNGTTSQYRKGAYHESLDFVQSLCDTSYVLVDIYPVEDRKSALRERGRWKIRVTNVGDGEGREAAGPVRVGPPENYNIGAVGKWVSSMCEWMLPNSVV